MNFNQELLAIAKLAIAYLLALPVGWYRETEAHAVGVRTFPVVAIASCGFILLVQPSVDAQSRVLQGVAAGIGFVGAGAILKSENHVHGTAAAASIWNTAAMGAAVALNHYGVGVMLSGLNLLALRALAPVKKRIDMTGPNPPA
jgi:putative Mg2+ transporter-C (MgtC) family protein